MNGKDRKRCYTKKNNCDDRVELRGQLLFKAIIMQV